MNEYKLKRIRRVNTQIYRNSYPGMPIGYKYINDNTIQGNIQNRLFNMWSLPNQFDKQSTYLPDGFKTRDKVPLSSDFENLSKKTREAALQSSYLSSITGQPKVNIFANEELKKHLMEELQNNPIINTEENSTTEEQLNDSDSDNDSIIQELSGQGFFDFLKPVFNVAKSLIPGIASVGKTIAKNPKIVSDAVKTVKEVVDTSKDIISPKKKEEKPIVTIPNTSSSKNELINHYHQMYLDGNISSKAYLTLLQELEAKQEKQEKEEKEIKKDIKPPKGTGVKRKYTKKVVTGTGVDDIIKDIDELKVEESKSD